MSHRRIQTVVPVAPSREPAFVPFVVPHSAAVADAMAPASARSAPWFALDENLLVRRVSPRFLQLTRGEAADYLGQSLFHLLGQFGVAAADLDRVRGWTTLGRSCFVDLRPGRLGERTDHFALELRPTDRGASWLIRYVAVGWALAGAAPLRDSAGSKRRRNRRPTVRRRFDECRRAGRIVHLPVATHAPALRPDPIFP